MKAFGKVILNAAIGGALSAGAAAWAIPGATFKGLGVAALGGAFAAILGLFQQKPNVPPTH